MRLFKIIIRCLIAYGHFSRKIHWCFYLGLSILLSTILFGYVTFKELSKDRKEASYNAGILDTAFKYRFSSPSPSDDIVIIDIDERSLSKMSEGFGRWPWPRSVFAELLLTLDEIGSKSIVFNLMFSDADIKDPDSDELFAYAASELNQVVYPITRLPARNDYQSEVQIKMIVGSEFDSELIGNSKVAVIYPYFESTHSHLGANNLIIEDDGIIRKSFLRYRDMGFSLEGYSSRVIKHLDINNKLFDKMPNDYLINWRGKRGTYKKFSFVDVYQALNGTDNSINLNELKDKIIIIGATAPGIAIPKVTPVEKRMDDNVIIANAIDDALNDTYLRPINIWIQAFIAAMFLFLMPLLATRKIDDTIIEVCFWAVQLTAVAISIISISYTPYFFDLSLLVYFGTAYYLIEKVHTISVTRSRKGMPPFRSDFHFCEATTVRCEINENVARERVCRNLEKTFGHKNIYLINSLFSDESVLADALPNCSYLIINAEKNLVLPVIEEMSEQYSKQLSILEPISKISCNNESEYLQEITRRCLENALKTVSK